MCRLLQFAEFFLAFAVINSLGGKLPPFGQRSAASGDEQRAGSIQQHSIALWTALIARQQSLHKSSV